MFLLSYLCRIHAQYPAVFIVFHAQRSHVVQGKLAVLFPSILVEENCILVSTKLMETEQVVPMKTS